MPRTKKIFISYAHADTDAAKLVNEGLRSIGMEPWIDSIEISPGQSFIERMSAGLSEASYVLALVSVHSMNSHWVNREWMAALAQKDIVLIPLILDDAPVPVLLKDILYIDFRPDRAKGVRQLIEFFLKENGGPVDASEPPRQQQQQQQYQQQQQQQQQEDPVSLRYANRRQVRLVASRCVDNATLTSYCYDVSISPNELEGASVQERLLSLLHGVDQRQEFDKFVVWLVAEKRRCVQAQLSQLQRDENWSWSYAR